MYIVFFNGDGKFPQSVSYGPSKSFTLEEDRISMKKGQDEYLLARWIPSTSRWKIEQADHGGEVYDFLKLEKLIKINWGTSAIMDDLVPLKEEPEAGCVSSVTKPAPYFPSKDGWALIRRTVAPNEHYLVGVFNSVDEAKAHVRSLYPVYSSTYPNSWKKWDLEEGWKIDLGITMGYWIIPCRPTGSWGLDARGMD